MELEITIREASGGLKSVRATDRKKNAEILKEFLNRNAAPSLLTKNTFGNRGYTWNNLFDDITEYILKETEKYETSKTFENTTAPLCASLLHLCVSGANKGKCYVKCEKITESCLYILKDHRLSKAVGDAYLNLLYKYVLPCDHYLGYIAPAVWTDLLDACINASSSSSFKTDCFTKLRLLLFVIKHGKDNCQFTQSLVNSLPKLEKHFNNISTDKKIQDVIIEIIIILLKTLSSEYRLTMCHFVESVLAPLIKCYDQNKDYKKKVLLFELLHLAVILHHPLGRHRNEEGSLANNWEVWSKYLNSISEIICLELTYLQKFRKQNDRILHQCSHFYHVAASVFYQLFQIPTTAESNTDNSAKRFRMNFNTNKSFNDLINELQQNPVPWLGIIHLYVKKYGSSISFQDYSTLLSCLHSILTSDIPHLDWIVFEELVTMSLINSYGPLTNNNEYNNTILSLWNTCVRMSTSSTAIHKAVNIIIQTLIDNENLKYPQAQNLIKMYLEKDIPVTTYSIQTLIKVFDKFYSKCSLTENRIKFFLWVKEGDLSSLDGFICSELLLKIVTDENIVRTGPICDIQLENEKLRHILFDSIEECILFTEFAITIPQETLSPKVIYENVQIITEIEDKVGAYFKEVLTQNNSKSHVKDTEINAAINVINIILLYYNQLLDYKLITSTVVINMDTYYLLQTALTQMYSSLNILLTSNTNIAYKIKTLQLVKGLLVTEFEPFLAKMIRETIEADMFHSINTILNTDEPSNDCDVIIEGDEDDINNNTLKRNCLFVLSAYCRKDAEYREDIVKLVLDESIYTFPVDMPCVFQCIEILIDPNVEDPPIDLIFNLLRSMCQKLYRNLEASFGILKILNTIIDPIWALDNMMKKNCLIMIKSYLKLCEDGFYPPKLVSLIFECVAKIIIQDVRQNSDIEESFGDAFLKKIKGNVHSIRLFCSYLFKLISNHSEDDMDDFSTDLMNMFLIDIPEHRDTLIKDESANRIFTMLHCYVALAQANKPLIQAIILQIINLHQEKSLDLRVTKKVLGHLCEIAEIKNLAVYLNENILSVIEFWFAKNKNIKSLPFILFEFDDVYKFVDKHSNWLIAGDILWRKRGKVRDSDILKQIAKKRNQSVENIVEACFSNIIALCLPYIVSKQYNIDYYGLRRRDIFRKLTLDAGNMFQLTGEILENDKWSNLFVENVGELLLLTARHMSDPLEVRQMFDVKVPQRKQGYTYPKRIFTAILDYFDTLTDGSVIQYLCKNQAVAIFKILFQLWRAVIEENIFEWKVLALYSYITFITKLPLGFPSDAFMSNFACSSFTKVIKNCSDKREMRVYIQGLKIVIEFLLPQKGALLRKSLLELLPVLIIKKESGYEDECVPIINYLLNDMKDYLKESADVMDFFNSMSSQGVGDNSRCYNLAVFVEKLKAHKISLNCPSREALTNIRQLLMNNKHHIQKLYNELVSKRFSEDCATSIIHQIVHSLCGVTNSANDDKTIVEAYNCLSEICSYDLKTLVTVPPADSEKVTSVEPRLYFAQIIVTSLLEIIFDKDVAVTNHVTETFNCFFKAIDVDSITDLDDIDTQILEPFLCSERSSFFISIESFNFELYVEKYENGVFLEAFLTQDSDAWLRQVTSTLLRLIRSSNNFENDLANVCKSKSQVCRKLLPPLVGLILQASNETQVEAISIQIKKFFNHIWDQTYNDQQLENSGDSNNYFSRTSTLTQSQKIVIQHVLDIVDFVRIQRNHYETRVHNAMKTLNFLDLDYNKLAWAASLVDQNWVALYYGELWAVFQNKGISPDSPESTANLTGGETLLRIFRKCYVSIGETDAIEGCGTAHLTIENEKRKHLINTRQFSDALLLHDIALSCGNQADGDLHHGVVRSLHMSGMHHLALQYIKTVPENDELDDVKYECLAFLGDWNDFIDVSELEKKSKQTNCYKSSFVKAFQYACLKNCLTAQTTPEIENKLTSYLNKAKLAVARLCRNLNLENCKNIYKVLEKIHIFNDIEDYLAVRLNRLHLSELLAKWDVDKLPQYNDFKQIEAMSTQRVIILEQAAKTQDESINEIVTLQIQYAKLALNNNRVEMAQRLLAVAKKSKWSEDIALVESEVSWAKGHKEIALSLLRNIVNNTDINIRLAAVALRRYALWMAESKRDNPREIISKYLLKSVELLKNEQVGVRLKVYHDIAKFADAEYKQVVAYMNSSAFENRVKCMENMEGTATSLSKTSGRTKEENKALSANKRFIELDEAEIANTRMTKENFLHLAMRYYLLSLKQSDENNLSVFRVISLWLSNQDFEFVGAEQESFKDLLHAIPSWKFVTVLPQLAPRLTNDDSDFIKNLIEILERCASDHPYHTLPILFGLKNSDKDNTILNASASRSEQRAREHEPRVLAATTLVTRLRDTNDQLRAIVLDMEKMCDAIISFANYMPPTKNKQLKIPNAERLHKLRNLTAIPVPTVTIPINVDCKYNYTSSLHSFEPYFELVGGVNCPKKINCTDSSGKKHVLLIKGGDDLKQDAVMQQVFNIVNTLLEKNSVTNRNKLLIRTYKVVPMSRLSGVLEWCEGTIPMGLYLVGQENKGAHGRYRPKDISCDAARKKMINCSNSSHEEKLSVYNRVVRDFKPVFHYFFTEHYLEPVTWYERRLAYTKSVATSSMVGYILGLGDRHVYNILIDKKTAEVIHIDLGIAFDQGKTLRTPETIPFRLTRDIIAGFGASGIEGIFRRCCEKTMQLLRDNQETLLTILEVLLCDPLYSWSVKTAQQNAPNTSRNASTMYASGSASGIAERALLVVTSKLSGTEDGVAGGVAVPGQVARLLHSATDPFNLCRLFHGWQPYL